MLGKGHLRSLSWWCLGCGKDFTFHKNKVTLYIYLFIIRWPMQPISWHLMGLSLEKPRQRFGIHEGVIITNQFPLFDFENRQLSILDSAHPEMVDFGSCRVSAVFVKPYASRCRHNSPRKIAQLKIKKTERNSKRKSEF
jgi:hypothetical protein